MTTTAFHFILPDWTTAYGRLAVSPGETLRHDGPIELCSSGLHASVRAIDALKYAQGPVVTLVECSGGIQHGDDKIVCSERRVLWGYNAADELRTFARRCALDAIHLWNAPQIVRDYLETGDEAWLAAALAAHVADAARAAEYNTWLESLILDGAVHRGLIGGDA